MRRRSPWPKAERRAEGSKGPRDSLRTLAWSSILAELEAGRAYLEKALPLLEKNTDPDNEIYLAWCLNDLALISKELGDYARAGSLFERALAIREAAYGKDHPVVAISLNNLGMHWLARGDVEKAVGLLERAFRLGDERG